MGAFISKNIFTCPKCRGKGQIILEENKCLLCGGNKYIKKEVANINIGKGFYNGQSILLKDKGDISQEYQIPGDIKITFKLNDKDEKNK